MNHLPLFATLIFVLLDVADGRCAVFSWYTILSES